jgi:glycosyltransferase involved in cell wall biosynthesis
MKLSLPPVVPFEKISGHENAWADHYGALHIASEYCGLRLVAHAAAKGIWQHGVFGPWSSNTPRLLAYNAPGGEGREVWVAREDQATVLRANGYPTARAIGMPILYAQPSRAAREPKSLLVMPGHALGGWQPPDRKMYERYADEIRELSAAFDHVKVCISPRDRLNGLWVREFTDRGFEVVDGAQTTDANALIRIRTLCEQFETVTTNCWGSHVAYALAFGAKVAICGTHPTMDLATVLRLDATWRADPEALKKAKSEAVTSERRKFLEEFYVNPVDAVANVATGRWLIGAEHQLSPEDMRILLPNMVDCAEDPWRKSAASRSLPGNLPLVLVRSHEFNYSETFVEDHVNCLTSELTLLYGYPFPRFRKGGQSVLSEDFEHSLKQALAKGSVGDHIWTEYTAGLAQFLGRCGAKAALVETGLMGAFVHQACEKAGLPFAVHFHGLDAFGRDLLLQWHGHYRAFFQTAAHLVVVSKAMQTQLVSLGAPPSKVLHAPYGVALDVPRALASGDPGPRFIAVGRFVEKKAPHLTLEAFAAVHAALPGARLTMIGDGPLLSTCRDWASRNGLSGAVHFAGVQSRDDVSRAMAESRVFVQHSVTASNGDSEGLPLAVLEAGAHGLPVVATRHAGIPDAVRDGLDGFLVSERDVQGMAAAMLRLANDAALAGQLGAAFRTRVEELFSRERSLLRLLAVMESTANGRAYSSSVDTTHAQTNVAAESDTSSLPNLSEQIEDAESSRNAGPERLIALDRNNAAAYLELGKLKLETGAYAEAYCAIGEAHRLTGETESTRDLLTTLEDHGALGESSVEVYRRRAGWLPRRKTARPRRVLVVTNLLPPQEMGGFGRTMWEFSRELSARGHTIQVLTADMHHLERKPTAEHQAFETKVKRTLKLCGDWREGAAVLDPDQQKVRAIVKLNQDTVLAEAKRFLPEVVMVGNLDFVGHFFVQALLDQGLPVVHRLGNARPGYEFQHTPQSSLYCIAGCSEWVNGQIKAGGYGVDRYAVLPPGSPLTEYFRAFPPERRTLRIAFASLLLPYKGPHVLLEALSYLQKAKIEFECTIAGDTTSAAYVEQLRDFASRHGFIERLQFPGFLGKKELAALYARSNVLVFPSVFEEPFGKTQVEAMAAGLMVISSGSGGAREIIRDGKTGLYFRNNDARDLAERLVSVHRQPVLAEKIALAGQAEAFRFTTQASVDRLETIIEELIAAAEREGSRRHISGKAARPTPAVASI